MKKMALKFPARYTMNLTRNTKTGEQKVNANLTSNQKVQLDNIKFNDVKHFSWDNDIKVSLLGVHDVKDEAELQALFEKYRAWEGESQKEEIEKLQAKLEAKYVFINNGGEDQRWAIQEQQIAQIEFLQKVIGEKDMAMFRIADFLDSLSQLTSDEITKEQCRVGIKRIKDATMPFSSRTQEGTPCKN